MPASTEIKAEEPNLKRGVTFSGQDDLPRLPIPDLQSTLDKYVKVLAPLQDRRDHEATKLAADEFLHKDGPRLQEKLKKYATGQTSYIEQFWYDSYLNFENPVVLNLNPFFLLEDDPTPARNNQVTRAASLVISALCFVRAVRKEELSPDSVRGQPLDMYQFSRLFGTARVPTDNGCHIAQDSGSKHIVVLCKGQFYWFNTFDDNSDLIMTEKDLVLNLQSIVDDAEQTPIQDAAKGAVGVLSTENRKTWASLRGVLTRDKESNNAEALSIVDTSLFVLCLDYTEPKSSSELCGNMLCGTNEVVKGVQIGTCTNRWYDKLQIIVCKNGSAGINFEHTGVDGHTVLRFASDVYTDTILRFAKSVNGFAPSLWASTSPDPTKRDPDSFGDVSTTPHKLEWDMIPELRIALRFAETRLADLIHQNEFQTLEFAGYGKNFITSMGFSPDAFVQMAFQAAYYGLYGTIENTYEPAMTKAFFHGRTEAIHVASPESTNFVRTFWADKSATHKVDALRRACEYHVKHTKECAKALGQDRHLYALYCVWQRSALAANFSKTKDEGTKQENVDTGPASKHIVADGTDPPPTEGQKPAKQQAMPSLFADGGWDRINTVILSTSNCGNPSLRQFGFGPTSGDGYGIGYIIKEERVSICASSKHRQTSRFIDAIESYFLEIRKLLRMHAAASKRDSNEETGGTLYKNTSRARQAGLRARGRGPEIVGGYRSKVAAAAAAAKPASPGLVNNGRESGASTTAPTEDLVFEEQEEDEDDDGLGGYGFFDAGMLKQALNANRAANGGTTHGRSDSIAGSETNGNGASTAAEDELGTSPRRHMVGKKLVLSDY